ncbi:efflux RND transporter permease subunit [Alteribacillus iranensis]|uniref:Multidrug efflux pump subunit AcrB n=1 Tax=Alteribacillus iranensis TaxID=930128 RepID=A0A1I2E4H5_9BACI|nr:efflux RND transporter permease subunit [Alteribacillus iranensis]SFE87401.1 Multidrug efflux pump subunit AcrB [Alteribacillus iranensis]
MKSILNRSKFYLLLIFILVLAGIYVFTTLEQREVPETTVNVINVTTPLPGASPEDVENSVTSPVEENISGITGVEEISSVSSNDISVITLTLQNNSDIKEVTQQVEQGVRKAEKEFPERASSSSIEEVEANTPLLSFMLTHEKNDDLQDLESFITTLDREVLSVEGVSSTLTKGLTEERVEINLLSEELREYQLTPQEIIQELEQRLQPVSLGEEEENDKQVSLLLEESEGIKKLRDLYVSNASVPLSDVADIQRAETNREDIITHNGTPAINYTVYLQKGGDAPAVSETITKIMEEQARNLPSDISIHPIQSQAESINDIFNDLYQALGLALLAVIFITSLGLTIFGALVVSLTVIASIFIGLIPIPWMGVDLNQISIIGLIIAIGILVDDSIVVNDNIQRRYKLGDQPIQGAITGVKEVYPSILSSSLAIVLTFSPLLFLSGANGEFIRALPSILITTIIASTILALLFVPIMRYVNYQRKKGSFPSHPGLLGKPLEWVAKTYAYKVLPVMIRKPLITTLAGVILASSCFTLIRYTPFEFFPDADKDVVTVDVLAPQGTPIETTDDLANEVGAFLEENEPVIQEVSVFTGTGLSNLFGASLDQSDSHTAQLALHIDNESLKATNMIDKWEERIRSEFPEADIFMETIVQGPPAGAPITVSISGNDMYELLERRDQLKEKIKTEANSNIVTDNVGNLVRAKEYEINKDSLEENQLSQTRIVNQLQLATEGIPIGDLYSSNDSSLAVQLFQKNNETLDLSAMEIPIPAESGPPQFINLEDVVSETETEVLPQIPHKNGKRTVTLRAFGDHDGFEQQVTSIVEDQRTKDSEEFEYKIGGEESNQQDFFQEITILFIIILLLVYLVIAFQFKSFGLPFLILLAVFLAIAGAVVGLFITQTPISFLGVMGMVSLTGIVVRNAVVLIDFVEQRRGTMNIHQAVLDSGYARIKPILLTTLTSITALVPVALSGDPLFEPLAITIIAGISFSTILTVLIVPSCYMLFAHWGKIKG